MSFEAQLKSNYALVHDRLVYPLRKPKLVAVSPPGKVKKPVQITQISPVSTPKPSMGYLLQWVSETEGVPMHDLRGPLHHKSICAVRFIFCYLARTYAGVSLPSIGRFLGGRDHTTIISAVNKIKVHRLGSSDLCQRVAYYETILDEKYGDRGDKPGETVKCPHCSKFFNLAK